VKGGVTKPVDRLIENFFSVRNTVEVEKTTPSLW
jgi:hypothetical protein